MEPGEKSEGDHADRESGYLSLRAKSNVQLDAYRAGRNIVKTFLITDENCETRLISIVPEPN